MSCKIEHKKYQGIESPLGEKLLEIYKDLSKAKEVYDTISSSEFIDKFGDWINEDISNRTNELYEPLLVEKIGLNNSKDYYFLDKNEDPIDLIVREFSSFETDNLTNEIKEITEQISSYIFKKYIKENFDNITSIKKINVSSEINEFVDLKINEYEDIINSLDSNEDISIVKETIDYLKLIKDHNSEFTTEIINFFNSKKLKINQDIVEDDIQTSQNDGLQGGDITQSFEKNSKDNATANVKLLLSFLPRYDYDNNNNVFEKSYGSALGEELFIPMDVVHKELLKELSDIITLNSENGVSDVYEQMIGVISNLSNKKYYYRDLLSLLDNISEDKKTEFVSAFFNSKINFYTSIIKGKEYSSYKSFNSTEQKSKADKLLNEWNITFRSNFIDDTNKSFNLKKLETLSSRFNELIISLNKERKGLDFNTITDQEFINKFQDITQGLIDGFNYLGITDLTEEGFNLFLNRLDTNNESNSYLIMFNKLQGTLIKTQNMIKSLSSNPKNIQVNPFREYKSAIFKSLSEAEAFYKEDGSEDTIISGGKMYWTFSRPSYISNTINKIKQSPEVLEEITNITINKNSVFARHLLGKDKSEDGDYLFDEQNRSIKSNSRIEKLELGIFNSFEEEGDSINSDDNTTISYVDQLVDELNKVLIGGIKNNKGRKVGNSSIYST